MLEQKIAVVTGATSGIGFATARELARRNFHVIAMGRNSDRIAEKNHEILADVPQAKLSWVTADLSSPAQVRRAVTAIEGMAGAIDVLVNNAGLILEHRTVTPDGLEMTFAVNHLAPFVLTTGLLPLLKRGHAHILNVTSIGHTMIDGIRWNDLQTEHGYTAIAAYAQTKLANILFTRELARRFTGETIIASAIHPGLVYSRFHVTAGVDATAHYDAAKANGTALTEEQGADTVIWLATTPEAALPSGGYFSKRQRIDPSSAAQDPASAERLWKESEQLAKSLRSQT